MSDVETVYVKVSTKTTGIYHTDPSCRHAPPAEQRDERDRTTMAQWETWEECSFCADSIEISDTAEPSLRAFTDAENPARAFLEAQRDE